MNALDMKTFITSKIDNTHFYAQYAGFKVILLYVPSIDDYFINGTKICNDYNATLAEG
jgi:hypothetical protein